MLSISTLTSTEVGLFPCNTTWTTLLVSWRIEGLKKTMFWSICGAEAWTSQSGDDLRELTIRLLRNVAERLGVGGRQSIGLDRPSAHLSKPWANKSVPGSTALPAFTETACSMSQLSTSSIVQLVGKGISMPVLPLSTLSYLTLINIIFEHW